MRDEELPVIGDYFPNYRVQTAALRAPADQNSVADKIFRRVTSTARLRCQSVARSFRDAPFQPVLKRLCIVHPRNGSWGSRKRVIELSFKSLAQLMNAPFWLNAQQLKCLSA